MPAYAGHDFKFETSTDGSNWTDIGGVQTWSDAPNTPQMDVGAVEDGGARKMQNSGHSDTITLNCVFRAADSGTNAGLDAGQQILLTAARSTGAASVVHLRIRSRRGTSAVFWQAQVTVTAPAMGAGTGARNDRAQATYVCANFGPITTPAA